MRSYVLKKTLNNEENKTEQKFEKEFVNKPLYYLKVARTSVFAHQFFLEKSFYS